MNAIQAEVLLVDDDKNDRLLLRRMLERFVPPSRIYEAADLNSALAASKVLRFDCAIVDFYLPDGTAEDFLRETGVASVVLTGADATGMEERSLSAGAQEFLKKGTATAKELAAAVDRAMDRQRVRSRLIRENQLLRIATETDPLTGLANRVGLDNSLRAGLSKDERVRKVSAVLIDCDGLRETNARGGHGAGDLALQDVARGIRSVCSVGDVPGRVGGDEFLILLPNCDLDDAELFAIRLHDELLSQDGDNVTVSIGISEFACAADVKAALAIARCDGALRAAKLMGGGRTVRAEYVAKAALPRAESLVIHGRPLVDREQTHIGTRIILADIDSWGDPGNQCRVSRGLEYDFTLIKRLVDVGLTTQGPVVLTVHLPTLNQAAEEVARLVAPLGDRAWLRVSECDPDPKYVHDALAAIRQSCDARIGLAFPSIDQVDLRIIVHAAPDWVFVDGLDTACGNASESLVARMTAALRACGVGIIAVGVQKVQDWPALLHLGVEYGSGPAWGPVSLHPLFRGAA